MRLRSITLSGFKTFARPTEISFDPGVTAIVGPNGSGKSNAVDAFKWVLGESQAKDLRGKKMEEVIYSGGQRRSRAAQAEVTILIDNADGRLPLDYGEVAIRRRVDRRGESDYFLNGSRVRRRDLLELLAPTGLTTDSYAIVDQRDIESIISSTPEQRRLLIEAAAQVKGVKLKRTQAAGELRELAQNLLRLEDVKGEIEPRLAAVGQQAEAAREAAGAQRRLEVLRGSLAWEEWREARDAHRRATQQVQSLQRRHEELQTAAEAAEWQFKEARERLSRAQDRRLERQKAVSAARLALQQTEHELLLNEERRRSQAALAVASEAEAEHLAQRLAATEEMRAGLAVELKAAERSLSEIAPARPPPPTDAGERATESRRQAEIAQRRLGEARTSLAAAEARRQVLQENGERLAREVTAAEAALAGAESEAERALGTAREAAEALAQMGRLQAELQGLDSLSPAPGPGRLRVGDVILARPGYEAALSAVLGPLVDAWTAPTQPLARQALESRREQTTVLFPLPGEPAAEPGSLFDHVTCEPGFEPLGRRLLGSRVIGREVSLDGTYAEPGLLRSGHDPRVANAARRRQLVHELQRLEPLASGAVEREAESRQAQRRVQLLRAQASERSRLEQLLAQIRTAAEAEQRESARLPDLELAAGRAGAEAEQLTQADELHRRRLEEHRAELRRLELERLRWRERLGDLRRQSARLERDSADLERAIAAQRQRLAVAEGEAAATEAGLGRLAQAVEQARLDLARVEASQPDEEEELAAAAKALVAKEEARVAARLRVSTLEGTIGLHRREAELCAARMEELRARMPEGLAPEEVPGGKAREREMKQLERRLTEIGPTNSLAEAEFSELEERYSTLCSQLQDITAARADLEQLIEKLRAEEESRYDAVFGAVAANFEEFFGELTAGGRGTLKHVPGEEGPRSGLDILVQPPRKRLQNVSLLSSGERSLTALALVLALQEINPAPFTILDEVDAALDDANVARYGEVLQRLGRTRQLMIITHNHLTMASASALFGVHLDESGCSHLVSVRLQDVQPVGRAAAARTA
ncbi:MAG: AAA family ATPase [Candidatus Dormibacter sp.]|uniref:AAA family ATPase n=1 Tax=Candidatus Dormibacter sp. TaxID=2973982 RepID=UPI0026853F6B